jgi:hypothetical protein
MLTNRSVRFGFGGTTVLVACSGDQMSFNTTVGGFKVAIPSCLTQFMHAIFWSYGLFCHW